MPAHAPLLRALAWLAGSLLWCGGLAAQPAPAQPAPAQPSPTQPAPAAAPAQSAAPNVQRPRLLKPVQPKYPPKAWEADIEGNVVLLLMLAVDGRVMEAEVVSTPGHGLEIAAIVATKTMRFSPALIDGKPVKVRVRYTFRFRKPEKATVALPPERAPKGWIKADPRPKGTLKGAVLQRGTGRPLKGAEVYLLDLDSAVLTDKEGRFSKDLSPGGYAVTIRVPGHHVFQSLERVKGRQTVKVKYYVEPKRNQRYRTIVWGSEGKATVGRTTLADAEIYEVPGTLGDPIRVVMLMPGVTTSVSGVGYPIVRGVLPADTRYEVDGVNVPMLYHLMLGNSVVNPRYTTGITFQPGGYGAEHGRYPGALIQAGAAAKPEQMLTAGDLSIIHTSLFHAHPITDNVQVMAGGRLGTLGLIIEGLASDAVFNYWDYQLKTFWQPSKRDEVQFIFFGAGNEVGEDKPDRDPNVFQLGFQRGDLRWRRTLKRGWFQLDLEAGTEGFEPPEEQEEEEPAGVKAPGDNKPPGVGPPDNAPAAEDDGPPDFTAGYHYLALRGRASWSPMDKLELRGGAGAWWQDFDFDLGQDAISAAPQGITAGAWMEAEWSPDAWTIVPGVRVDHYRWGIAEGERETSVDPRFAVGYKINSWLSARAAAGIYHGPPRFTLVAGPIVIGPVPGMLGVGLDRGLNRTYQVTGGLEAKLPWRFQGRIQGFYNDVYTPIDFSLMGAEIEPPQPDDPATGKPPEKEDESEGDALDRLTTQGRTYGMEMMLRRKLGEKVFGWLTWSMSRSERDIKDIGTLPFLFDQTHVVNGVISWEVGRKWTLGATFHFHTGRPYTPRSLDPCREGATVIPVGKRDICWGPALGGRLPDFWRLDLRMQKREMFDTWYFDYYFDLINATANWEVIGFELDQDGQEKAIEFPLIVPMMGLRGQF